MDCGFSTSGLLAGSSTTLRGKALTIFPKAARTNIRVSESWKHSQKDAEVRQNSKSAQGYGLDYM